MKPAHLSALVFLLAACAATGAEPIMKSTPKTPWPGRIESWGTLREALRDGQVQGRVAVADQAREDVYAVGALEGLRGEVTIADGEVWLSEVGEDGSVTTRTAATSAMATVLFAAEVPRWTSVTVKETVDPSVLDAFLAEQAEAHGLDPSHPFPFVIEGGLLHLQMHVIGGECPVRARMLDKEVTAPLYELHRPQVEGKLVGIYAPDSSGVVCHMGSRTHAHVILDVDGGLTGHAETVGLDEGAILKLPRP